MSLEVLETVFRRIGEFLAGHPGERVEIIWHGGEPLLLGHAFFREAKRLQDLHCAPARDRISHAIQTNLTLFDDSFVEPLRALGVRAVGTSFDAEPGARGGPQPRDSEAYTRQFLSALARLERHGFDWGMIYVVTRRSLARPLDIFRQLTNLQLTGSTSLNPVLVYGEQGKDLALTPGEYAEFLGAIFPTWWRERARYRSFEPFRSMVENIIAGRRRLACVDSGTCSFHHVNVAPDGTTSQCGRSADWDLLPYGNLADRPLSHILRDPQRAELDRRYQVLHEGDCAGCRFWPLCHGGCPLDSWSQHKTFDHKTAWCEAKRGFIEKYFEPVTGARWAGAPEERA
jgi:radical SAM protein with 4Fe4S-binding SPASM domain